MHEEVLDARREPEVLFAQQPHLGGQSAVAPLVGGRHAHGREPCRPRTIGAIAPRHAAPGPSRQRERHARTVIGRVSFTSTSCERGRPVRALGGICTAGVPRNTVRWRETPERIRQAPLMQAHAGTR